MNMKDLDQLINEKQYKAYALLGYALSMLDGIRNGMKIDKSIWHELDEHKMAYECACRDLDTCFTHEAMINSIED